MLFEMGRNNARIPAIKHDIGSRDALLMEKLLGFAKARGEKFKPLSETALTLPFDLIRVGFLWERRPIDQRAWEQLVDEILLPVFMG